jgi:uncharacterized membrane protein YedE/YeeE
MVNFLFNQTWSWWAGGLGIGLTALGLAWFMGKKLGVTGGYVDACSLISKDKKKLDWKLFFIAGLPLGGALASVHYLPGQPFSQSLNWSWTFLFGQLDGLMMGNPYLKLLWLFIGGLLVGYGARWAAGCVSSNSIMGIPLGNKMSIFATVGFLTAGVLTAHLIFKFFGVL